MSKNKNCAVIWDNKSCPRYKATRAVSIRLFCEGDFTFV